jgi:hypothetical protein
LPEVLSVTVVVPVLSLLSALLEEQAAWAPRRRAFCYYDSFNIGFC